MRALLTAGLAAVALFADVGAALARCDWTVTGRLAVAHELTQMSTAFGATQPLVNVRVRVKAKSRVGPAWGSWATWSTQRTDANGNFRITRQRGCGDRRFRVEVRFDDANLEIRHAGATSSPTKVISYPLVDDATAGRQRRAGTVNLGTMTFGVGRPGIFGQFEPRRHAQIWTIYRLMRSTLLGFGNRFDFGHKLVVKYPHNSWVAGDGVEASYANPITKIVYIFRGTRPSGVVADHFNVHTLFHEAFHIWAYRHFKGEGCLTWDLVLTHDTHDLAPNSCSAFHEGFAEIAADLLMQQIFGDTVARPHNRARLATGNVAVAPSFVPLPTVALVQRLDEGWWSVLRTMTLDDLHRWRFSAPTDTPGRASQIAFTPGFCSSPNLGLRHILRVFLESPNRGFPNFLSKSETTISAFMNRAVRILPGLTTSHSTAIQIAQNPTTALEPAAILCTPIGTRS